MSGRRSACPINIAIETFGDAWSLLIVRDMVYFGKRTFGEFLASQEGIARNILADRLARLRQRGLLTKRPHPTDGRKDVYELTEAGLDLIPILLELAAWGAAHGGDVETPQDWIEATRRRRATAVRLIREAVRRGGAVFAGPRPVAGQLLR